MYLPDGGGNFELSSCKHERMVQRAWATLFSKLIRLCMHLPNTVAMLMCQLRAGLRLRPDSCMYFLICFALTNHLFLNN